MFSKMIPLLDKTSLIQNGLVAEHRFNQGSGQVLFDFKGNYHGQLGSLTTSDTNDPTWSNLGLTFVSNDYVKLPLVVDPQNNFTVYIVINIGSAPAGTEYILCFGNSGSATQLVGIYRGNTGALTSIFINNANTPVYSTIAAENVISGIRLFAFKRNANNFNLIDVSGNVKSTPQACPSSPIVCDQIAYGCKMINAVGLYLNQPIYYGLFYNRATTDAEDKKNYLHIKKSLLKRGVILG